MPATIIISEGDPAGIGYEILNKSKDRLKYLAKGNLVILARSQCKVSCENFEEIGLENLFYRPPRRGLYQVTENCLSSKNEKEIHPGRPSVYSGRASFQSFQLAIRIQKKIGGNLITLPLSKEWVIKSGVKNFRGHTEELAESYKKHTTMMMFGPTMRVIVLTTHIPLGQVPSELRRVQIQSIISGIKNFSYFKNPSIAICGLNPHAGEGGKIGNEEKTILSKIIGKFRMSGLNISEPISADSLFQTDIRKKFDLILACYHDQGLIPFKSIEGKKGINVTLGLDFLRVSPDHGTAFDIAGKGIADPSSFLECLKIAQKM